MSDYIKILLAFMGLVGMNVFLWTYETPPEVRQKRLIEIRERQLTRSLPVKGIVYHNDSRRLTLILSYNDTRFNELSFDIKAKIIQNSCGYKPKGNISIEPYNAGLWSGTDYRMSFNY